MGSQSLGHLLVMVLIVLGNVGVWANRRLGLQPTPQPPAERPVDEGTPPPPETPMPDQPPAATEDDDEHDEHEGDEP
jgi:hypothetical protein